MTFYYVVVMEQMVDQWCNAELQNTDKKLVSELSFRHHDVETEEGGYELIRGFPRDGGSRGYVYGEY